MQLQNTTVLVPGAARPIGRQIAHRFAREGARLVLPWFDWPESVAEMNSEFSDTGADVLSEQCDLRDLNAVGQLMEKTQARFGGLDILINNIERGGMPVVHGSYEKEQNLDQWQLEMDTTVKAKYNLFQASLDLLNTSGSPAVVNISSIAAKTGRSGPAAKFFSDGYSAANSAVGSLTQTWARQAAPKIRVNEVMLGLINSRHGENTRGWTALSAKDKRALYDHILLKRLGSPKEVADLVFFVAVEATYLCGATISMDGGYLLGGDEVPDMGPGILS